MPAVATHAHPSRHDANVNAVLAGGIGVVFIAGAWLTFTLFAPWAGTTPSVATYAIGFAVVIPLLGWYVLAATREDEAEDA